MLLNLPCAFVDLETTGTSAHSEGITEVGLRLYHPDGTQMEWQQLLNPGKSIPGFIQQLTGISNAMVGGQPFFSDIAPELYELLDGAVFIAHSARFDYSFLKNAFAQCGYSFKPRIVCTVKLSRALYPQHQRHNLDTICQRISYTRETSHRALADVQAMCSFVRYAIQDQGIDAVNAAASTQFQRPAQPLHIDIKTIDAIPNVPGVYRFFGEHSALLYVGKSVRLRERVMSHFSADITSAREMRLSREVHHIEWTVTVGELGALLLENAEIKELSPIYNRRQRRYKNLWCFELEETSAGVLLPRVSRRPLKPDTKADKPFGSEFFGLYRSKAVANKWFAQVIDEQRLCKKLLELESGPGCCFNYQLNKCAGACCGDESVLQHNLRVRQAFSSDTVEAWPFAGPAVICESAEDWRDREIINQAMHVIDNWAYIGTVCDASDISALLSKPAHVWFDKETYRIVNKEIHRAVPVAEFIQDDVS